MKTLSYTLLLAIMIMLCACDQEEWLDIRSNKKQVVPNTLQDYQALLDHLKKMNAVFPSLGEVGTDDYYVSQEDWEAMTSGVALIQHQAYVWAEQVYQPEDQVPSWNYPYTTVYYANVVLDGMKDFSPTAAETETYHQVVGSAYFYRAWTFYQLAQIFCPPYEAATAAENPGLPLRLEADINIPSKRASLQRTYDQILEDLNAALPLLPDTPLEATRPSRASVYALMAKLFLQTGEYDLALTAADNSLQLFSTLMDYNTIDASSAYPFQPLNAETLFYNRMSYVSTGTLSSRRLKIAPNLINSYEEHDLRKTLFYKQSGDEYQYRGSYDGGNFFAMYFFSGIAADELYLIRSECHARAGHSSQALDDLNTLLSTRYESGYFAPVAITNEDELLNRILLERRKELVFRGIRWADLRRYQAIDQQAISITRQIGDQEYQLPSGDPRWTLPLPYNVISLTNMEQNER